MFQPKALDHLGFLASLPLLALPVLMVRLSAKTNRTAEAAILLITECEDAGGSSA